jgi:hypothetical protein
MICVDTNGRKPQEGVSKASAAHEVGDSRGVCRPFHGLDGAPNLTQGFAFGYTVGFMLPPASRAWKNTKKRSFQSTKLPSNHARF